MMLTCGWAQQVWYASNLSYKIDVQKIRTFDESLKSLLNIECKKAEEKNFVRSYIAYVCWEIWKVRNEAGHNRKQPRITETAIKWKSLRLLLNGMVQEFYDAQQHGQGKLSKMPETEEVKWETPGRGCKL